MSTQISSKLAALALALMMNTLIIGAVAELFNTHQERVSVIALDRASAQTTKAAS